MNVKLGNYNRKYRIVSLALNSEVRDDLLGDNIDFLYISEHAIWLYPDNIKLSEDENVIDKLRSAHNYDVYELWENGRLSEYYDDSSLDNYFFVTAKCNSNCIMCPSPDISRQKGGNTNVNTLIEIAKHIPEDAPHLTITGGEPFMIGPDIFRFFEFLRDKFEGTEFLLLTNGRIFAIDSYVQRFIEKAPNNSIIAIPIHGSTASIHDMITQAEGSFNQTMTGIKKLLKAGIHIELQDAKEYGSILTVTPQDWSALYDRFAEIKEDIHISREAALRGLLPLVQVAEALAQKYDVVVTNPPYAGAKGFNEKLKHYIEHQYPNEKTDLYAVFVSKSCQLSKYICSIVTPITWMYNPTFKDFRKILVNSIDIASLLEFGTDAFDVGFGTASYTYYVEQYKIKGKYYDLTNIDEKNKFLLLSYKIHNMMDFNDLDYKINHKVPNTLRSIIQAESTLSCAGTACIGLQTNDNNRFIRDWYEISNQTLSLRHVKDTEYQSWEKWFPIVKYTSNRKWYGNMISVVDWKFDGAEIKNLILAKGESISRYVRSEDKYFKGGLTWSHSTYGTSFSMRILPPNTIINIEGPGVFDLHEQLYYVLALMNSKVASYIFETTIGSIHVQSGDINKFPYCYNCNFVGSVDKLAKSSVFISKFDWDSFETSWNFQHHPLLREISTIAEAFDQWQSECDDRFNQLKSNEEELNRIFIDIYGLQDELIPDVEDKDVTVRTADLGRDIRSFISYAVGCMFGRYSLDVDGLVYAGGEWDNSKYASFAADKDNIIPICDDEYFEDDIVGLFVEFVKTVYGADTLDENMKFIADALGGKGQPKDVIRNYFLNDFYKDHCKIYQKRPIYWLFDSGKKNGFKALIYMHRYQPDTIARIRTDYVHEQQARYRTAIADLEQRIANASTGERVKLNKKLTTLQAQDTEIRTYEEKIHHLADQMISIDLDDGVKKNYAIFQDVLAKIK